MESKQRDDELRHLTERQRSQLATVRDLWRGKTVVMEGGSWTTEAREPQRKQRLMEQLQLAKQLRLLLEEAAKQSEKTETTADEARKLILDRVSDMNRLASLTEAVRGKYTLDDSYQDYNRWSKQHRKVREEKLNRAKATLKDQIERMADPQRPWHNRTDMPLIKDSKQVSQKEESTLSRINATTKKKSDSAAPDVSKAAKASVDTKLMERRRSPPKDIVLDERKPAAKSTRRLQVDAEAMVSKKRKLSNFAVDNEQFEKVSDPITSRSRRTVEAQQGSEKVAKRDRQYASRSKRKQYQSASGKATTKQIDKGKKESDHSKASMPVPDAAFSMPPPPPAPPLPQKRHRPYRRRSTTSEQDRTGKSQATSSSQPLRSSKRKEDEIRPYVVASSTTPVNAPKKTTTQRPSKKKKSTGPKKCHYCKQFQHQYLKCQYFQATGSKCGKFYCVPCLKDHYPGQWDEEADPEDWHCPSCLGTCKCPACEKVREREVRRSLANQERQRSKRKIRQAQHYSGAS